MTTYEVIRRVTYDFGGVDRGASPVRTGDLAELTPGGNNGKQENKTG